MKLHKFQYLILACGKDANFKNGITRFDIQDNQSLVFNIYDSFSIR